MSECVLLTLRADRCRRKLMMGTGEINLAQVAPPSRAASFLSATAGHAPEPNQRTSVPTTTTTTIWAATTCYKYRCVSADRSPDLLTQSKVT